MLSANSKIVTTTKKHSSLVCQLFILCISVKSISDSKSSALLALCGLYICFGQHLLLNCNFYFHCESLKVSLLIHCFIIFFNKDNFRVIIILLLLHVHVNDCLSYTESMRRTPRQILEENGNQIISRQKPRYLNFID